MRLEAFAAKARKFCAQNNEDPGFYRGRLSSENMNELRKVSVEEMQELLKKM